MYSPIYYCPCCKYIHTRVSVKLTLTITDVNALEYTNELGKIYYASTIELSNSTYQIHKQEILKCTFATCKKDKDLIPLYIAPELHAEINKLRLAWVVPTLQMILKHIDHVEEKSQIILAQLLLEQQNN